MPITISPDDVRGALNADQSDYSDDDLAFEIKVAEEIVNDDLAPHSNDTSRLELVGALIAAAYVHDDGEGSVSSVQQASRQISFDSENALSYWRRAVQLDPTGKLAQLEQQTATVSVPDARGIDY
ncbi:hypothetical protein [Halocatena marina]|uniref:hypothetical protein n=1 Tax=Halocatena marina TaxID=2934937 RepID=UPI002010622D|nr:hypothetical protein [Halocatena marina]